MDVTQVLFGKNGFRVLAAEEDGLDGEPGVVAFDETWTSVAWRRQNAQDEFHDAHALWRYYGLEIVPMTEPPRGPPDIARGWRRVHSPFIHNGYGSHGWAWR